MRELDEADAQDVALFYRGRSSASRPAGGSDVFRQHLSSDATPGTSGPSGPWRPRPTLPSSRIRRGRVLMSDEQAPALEALSGVECYRLLAAAQVGRLGVNADGYPLIFPVNYALDGAVILLRTQPGTKLGAADYANVTFEVDHIDPRTRSGWSVLVRGVAEEITAAGPGRTPVGVRAGRRTPGRRANAGALDTHPPHGISGRRIVPGAPPAEPARR